MTKAQSLPPEPRNQIECDGATIRYRNLDGETVDLSANGDVLMQVRESLTGLAWALDYPLRKAEFDLTIEEQEFLGHIVTAMRDMREKLDRVCPDSDDYMVDLSPKGVQP